MKSQKTSYSEKLKDPRWQKKRLEIFERDEWVCQMCYCSDRTLNVHHRMYKKGAEPWEYPNEYLVTLCESCHEDESKILERCVNEFIEIIRCKFFAVDISELSTAFRYIESGHSSLCLAESIKHFLLEPANIEKIEEDYIKYREIAFKPNTLFGDLPLNP